MSATAKKAAAHTAGEHAGEAKKPQTKAIPAKERRGGKGDPRRPLVDHMMRESASDMVDVKVPGKGAPTTTLLRGVGDREYQRTMLGTRPYRAVLAKDFGNTSGGSATALTVVYAADMALAAGISSWAGLFDEMRCTAVDFRFNVGISGQTTGGTTGQLFWTASFDPSKVAAISSHEANLVATKSLGPVQGAPSTGISVGSSQAIVGPQPVSQRGHYSLGSGRLQSSVLPGASAGVLSPSPVQGDWVPTTTSVAEVGYLKFYGDTPTANVGWLTRVFAIYHAEFRMRG